MPKGWKAFVYRTDGEKEQFAGFFYDAPAAATWIGKQTEGTYVVSDVKPSIRTPKESK